MDTICNRQTSLFQFYVPIFDGKRPDLFPRKQMAAGQPLESMPCTDSLISAFLFWKSVLHRQNGHAPNRKPPRIEFSKSLEHS